MKVYLSFRPFENCLCGSDEVELAVAAVEVEVDELEELEELEELDGAGGSDPATEDMSNLRLCHGKIMTK